MRISKLGLAILISGGAVWAAEAKAPAKKASLVEAGKVVFEANCASCHGPTGQGDGAAAAALDPKPRNLADAVYMKTRPAATLRKVIAEGGQSVGLSPLMIAWQGMLQPEQIDAVLAYVQSLSQTKKQAAKTK